MDSSVTLVRPRSREVSEASEARLGMPLSVSEA